LLGYPGCPKAETAVFDGTTQRKGHVMKAATQRLFSPQDIAKAAKALNP
jgi:hypothetical protein